MPSTSAKVAGFAATQSSISQSIGAQMFTTFFTLSNCSDEEFILLEYFKLTNFLEHFEPDGSKKPQPGLGLFW
jgi:hypothetical protein